MGKTLAQCDTCGVHSSRLLTDVEGASHCPHCWDAAKDKPGYVAKLRDVYHVELRRTDPRQCADEAYTVDQPAAALDLLRDILSGREQESFVALMLDTRCRITAWREVGRGTSDSVSVNPRDLFRTALMCGATKIVVAHNHPSGDPSPSKADIEMTKRVTAAGALLGIDVLDHIIIGAGESFFSFAANGMPRNESAPLMTGPRQAPELD